jgi:hypothetical protein
MGKRMARLLEALAVLLIVVVIVANRIYRRSKTERDAPPSSMVSAMLRIVDAPSTARRALCLASVMARTNLEYELQSGSRHKPSEDDDGVFQTNQRQWMQANGLWDALSSRERMLLEKPLETWSMQEIADGQWRAEAIAVLLWALNPTSDLPPYDKQIVGAALMDSLPPPDHAARFIMKARLRDTREISSTRAVAELWLWRARTTQLQSSGAAPPKGWTFERIIATTAEKARGDSVFVPIDHDFPAFNKAYSKLSNEEWQTMRSISEERLYTLNWLCKYAENWDEVPTGT